MATTKLVELTNDQIDHIRSALYTKLMNQTEEIVSSEFNNNYTLKYVRETQALDRTIRAISQAFRQAKNQDVEED